MALRLEIDKYLDESPVGWKIIKYLVERKAATIYQIAEAIHRKPSEFEDDLLALEGHGIIRTQSDPYQKDPLQSSMYLITGYGHHVYSSMHRRAVNS